MIERTTEKRLSTPAVARLTARWAMRYATTNPDGYYALITAKVFTVFMFEGVVDHLGELLCSTWKEPRTRSGSSKLLKARAREDLACRHKFIRSLMQLDNSNAQYQEISDVVSRLVTFRDAFAHPKVHELVVQESVRSDLADVPGIAWETEVDADKVNQIVKDFHDLETYSINLLDRAGDCLENNLAQGWDVWHQQYPHLNDLYLEATLVRGFLHSPSQSVSDSVLTP